MYVLSHILQSMGIAVTSEVLHLADEPHGDLPPPAGHLRLRAIDRGPLEALVVAP